MKKYIYSTRFLLPKNADYHTWSVIACDQFTSEHEYWNKLKEIVGDNPSILNLVLPEIYLSDDNTLMIEKINQTMKDYLDQGVFSQTEKGYVLIERKTPYVERRLGLMTTIDLEDYDFLKKSTALTRATEGTIQERIPPRLQIRQNAPMEFSHIMVLYDDETRSINEKLFENRDSFEKIYDFSLNMNGGQIKGWFIKENDSINQMFEALIMPDRMMKKYGDNTPFLFAVGDGNHSLATAKTHWDNIKKNLSEEEKLTHPARYCLVELVNIYDEGIYFEPIHRFVKGVDKEFIDGLQKLDGDFSIYYNKESLSKAATQALPQSILAVDNYIKEKNNEVDYIHGDENLKKLVDSTPNSVGILFKKMDKDKLFSYVAKTGSLPRKTFSMGEGVEKRYYLEAKFITTEN